MSRQHGKSFVGVVHHHGVELAEVLRQEGGRVAAADRLEGPALLAEDLHGLEAARDRLGMGRHAAVDQDLARLGRRGWGLVRSRRLDGPGLGIG